MADQKNAPVHRTHPQSWGEANHCDVTPSWKASDRPAQAQSQTPEPKKHGRFWWGRSG